MRPLTLLDVFGRGSLSGNQLAVFEGADDLDADAMLALAIEMSFSETTFVQSPRAGGDYRVRIFTVTGELPFAGHPTLGTAFAVARRRGLTEASLVQECEAGLIDVRAEVEGAAGSAALRLAGCEYADAPEASAVAAALGIEPEALDHEMPSAVGSTGIPHLLVGLRDARAVAGLTPRWDEIEALCRSFNATTLYAFAADRDAGAVRARCFPAVTGGREDPATGSAAAPLADYLRRTAGMARLEISQGEEIGRPSTIHTRAEQATIEVSGAVAVVAEGSALV